MAKRSIGCALWSLAIPDTVQALETAARLGFEAVQFTFQQETDLEPAALKRIEQTLDRAGLALPAGMVGFAGEDYSTIQAIRKTGGLVDPATFPERLQRCRRWGRAMADLGMTHVTTHAGFIPEPGDAGYRGVLDRLGRAADALHDAGLTVGLETGQEPSDVLLAVLADLGRDFVSVNYDPANFVLYGSDDPVRAARALGPHVVMAHMKDGTASDRPGEVWGEDVPLGTGQVDFAAVLTVLGEGGFHGALVIEREAGTRRQEDVVAARRYLEDLLRRLPA